MAKSRKGSSRRGYYRAQFESAWARYCAEGVTASQPSNVAYIRQPLSRRALDIRLRPWVFPASYRIATIAVHRARCRHWQGRCMPQG